MASMGSNQYFKRGEPTLCWDCANACGGCSWSEKLMPVKGWKSEDTRVLTQINRTVESRRIIECPEFKRDSWGNGLYRKEPKHGKTSRTTGSEVRSNID